MPELGILGNHVLLDLDSVGNLTWPDVNPQRLCWGVGADDRWHFSEERASIRQSVDSNEITTITRMRVPGGDITQRVEVIPWGGQSVTKLEFFNETPIPVAISIMLLNFGPIEVNSTITRNDAKPIIASSKPPGMIINGSGYQDLTNQIMNSELEDLITSTSSINKSNSDNALIFPLPHSTKLEIIINNENLDDLPDIERLPSFTDVSNGWLKHFESGMEIQTEDNRLASLLNTARRHLLIGSDQEITSRFWDVDSDKPVLPLAALALMAWGHTDSAKKLIFKYMENSPTNLFKNSVSKETLYVLCLWQKYLEFCSQEEELEDIIPWLNETVHQLLASLPSKRRLKKRDITLEIVSLRAVIEILTFVQQKSLASELQNQLLEIEEVLERKENPYPFEKYTDSYQRAVATLGEHLQIQENPLTLDHILSKTDPTGSLTTDSRQQDPVFSALFLLTIRAGFLQENKLPSGENQIQIASSYTPDWIGVGIQVKNAPISSGIMGYAIRWHGTSPALLWEANTSTRIQINAWGLDKSWFSNDRIGETLLSKQIPKETAVTIHAEASPLKLRIEPDSPDSGTFQ
ncbi:MAG: hypothetical protein VX305_00610 [Actinomycetota bacterium]|nr:hypothetical protein [Actinomycetota bacterium]